MCLTFFQIYESFVNFYINDYEEILFLGLKNIPIRILKPKVKALPCLGIPHPNAFMIVQTDASEIGYGGILKQKKLASDSI